MILMSIILRPRLFVIAQRDLSGLAPALQEECKSWGRFQTATS